MKPHHKTSLRRELLLSCPYHHPEAEKSHTELPSFWITSETKSHMGKIPFYSLMPPQGVGKGRKSKRLNFEPKDIKILKMLIKILYKNNFTRLDHLLILLHSVWGCVYVYRCVCVRQRIFFSVYILSKELHSCCTLQTGVQCK